MKLRHDVRPDNPLQRRLRIEFLMVLPLPFAARLNAASGSFRIQFVVSSVWRWKNMSQILEATFDGAVFRPAEIVRLQPNTRVQLVVTVKDVTEEQPASFLRTARALQLEGPPDWSERLDDYLYGGVNLDDK